jgi:hypothetical protein
MAACRSLSSRTRQSFHSSRIDMAANVAADHERASQVTPIAYGPGYPVRAMRAAISPAMGTRTQAAMAANRIPPRSRYRPLQRAISRSAATERRTACARKNTGITVAAVA